MTAAPTPSLPAKPELPMQPAAERGIEFPPGDYVSPGMRRIRPDACFPFMAVLADRNQVTWPYLRRHIPHNFYSDRRSPQVGFLSRDEAHILYNTALTCRGQSGLEIGCWLGWSACHIALAGVDLDVIDPLLAKPEFYGSAMASLQAAGVYERVRLVPGSSPGMAFQMHALERRRWRLIFIDGNHDRPGPLHDAMAAHLVAAPDALVLFHDLASPEVTEGLDYLRQQGWNTMIYQTMQIMGVAWRGTARPVAHIPDPTIAWPLPAHLASYRVSADVASA
jgi:predicted O-methyltransferase YrrM